MSERPENPLDEQAKPQGGWQTSRQSSPWRSSESQPSETVNWYQVKALPDDLDEEPQERGTWHLPKEQDTSFDPDDIVEISDAPRMTTASTPVVQRPEDIIAQIVGQKAPSKAVSRPEDMMIPSLRKKGEQETAASDSFQQGETLLVDEESQTMPTLEEDDEALSMSELIALASLAQGDDDFSQVDSRDLSPAERILLDRVQEYERELPRTPAAASDFESTQTLNETSPQVGESAADVARRMAQQVADGGQADYSYQQSPQRQYTAEEVQLAQQFKETFRQVQVLRRMAQQGQIDHTELQTRLQQYTILDPQGNWWMIGYETNEWYRYNNISGDWELSQPPVPLEAASPRTETGVGQAAPDILADSLPYLPDDPSRQQVEYTTDYDATQYTDAQASFSQHYGVQEPPIPNPDQPVIDPGQTLVGNAWDRTTQTYAEPTIQGMPQVGDFGQTMPSPSQDSYYQQQEQYAYPEQGQEQYAAQTGFEEYDARRSSEVFEQEVQVRRGNILTVLGLGAVVLAIFVIAGAILGAMFIMYQYNQVVEPYRAAILSLNEQDFAFQTATILAADGSVITEIESEEGSRIPVNIADGNVSPFFIHAVVSSEDPTFYQNPGISFWAILRAFWQNYTSGEVVSGASTITQQIARERVIGNRAEGVGQKLTEALVALEISDIYSKTDILNIYINEFPFGQRAFGVESASQLYFKKSAAELDPLESAMLAGILPAPSTANPITSRTQAFNNMNIVISRMLETNCLYFEHLVDETIWKQSGQPFCINSNTLVASPDGYQPFFRLLPNGSLGGYYLVLRSEVEGAQYSIESTNRSHFVDYVLGQIDLAYGRGAYIQRGFTIQTTLLPGLQTRAEAALQQGVASLASAGARTGAAIVIDPRDGAIRAMVGSPDYLDTDIDGQNNLTLLPQQPGSAIKPVLYAAALEGSVNGYYSPAHITWDVQASYNIGGTIYSPTNFDGRFRGAVPVRYALAQSLNVPAVRTYAFLGVDARGYSQRFVEVANALGIDFDYSDVVEFTPIIGLPTAIGATEVSLMDLTHAYASIANDGQRVELYSIMSITERDPNGTELQVDLVDPLIRTEPVRAISSQTAYLLQDILSDDAARTATLNGIASSFSANSSISGASFGLPNRGYIAVKTGTNNVQTATGIGNPSRIWTVGFTNNWAVGVWIGTLNASEPMGGGRTITGATSAAPVWHQIMASVLNSDPGVFERPAGIREDPICILTGALSPINVNNCPANQRVSEIYAENFPPPGPNEGFIQMVEVNSWTRELWSASCGDEQNKVVLPFANINDQSVLNYLNTTGKNILTQLGISFQLEPRPTQSCQTGTVLPTVRIMSPSSDVVVKETVVITGQISAQNMNHWQLSVSPQNANSFTQITESARTDLVPNPNSTLGEWNSRGIENGFYTLRLEVYANDGGFIYRDINIVVNNPPATPTPIPQEPTLAPVILTPLPFPSPTPLGG
jgi:membrane peptidoglycan carboxypeptidase